ncbi:MAG: SoxR reducing system RseC family protein [Paludibacteraceae bacterium]
MDEPIRHEGIVLAVKDGKALVEIVQTSACSACKARGMCMSAESQEKRIDAVMTEPMKAGDKVEVTVTEKLAWKAVLLAYILPFVVMMVVIGLIELWIESEAIAGTVGLCAIALYYIVLSFFRGRLQKEFSFTARKVG